MLSHRRLGTPRHELLRRYTIGEVTNRWDRGDRFLQEILYVLLTNHIDTIGLGYDAHHLPEVDTMLEDETELVVGPSEDGDRQVFLS